MEKISNVTIVKKLNPTDFQRVKSGGKTQKPTITVGSKIKLSDKLCKDAQIKAGDSVEIVLLNSNRICFKITNVGDSLFITSKQGTTHIGITNQKLTQYILEHYNLESAIEKGIIKSHRFDVEPVLFQDNCQGYVLLPPPQYSPTKPV
jgi:hypothetical protein